jgi:hypothetical protein
MPDDPAARHARAEALRAQIDRLTGRTSGDRPPPTDEPGDAPAAESDESPRQFIERRMHEIETGEAPALEVDPVKPSDPGVEAATSETPEAQPAGGDGSTIAPSPGADSSDDVEPGEMSG